ncbi:YcxB family protein [Rossellomorea aquimaris]|nr:YcxB family protein [Rossellomorea aquimaris]WRP06254.1 YcxB family protein [Rossellomorea aquimaris]
MISFFLRYAKYHYRNKLPFIFLAIVLLYVALYIFSGDDITVWFIIPIFFSFLLTLFARKIILKKVLKEFKKEPHYSKHLTYHLMPDGITASYGRSTTYYEWTDIRKVYEKKELFLIYITSYKAMVIPKEYFHNDEDIALLKDTVRNHIPKANLKIL